MAIQAIRQFFRMCRLFSRHAVTLWQFKRYVIFSGCADYSVDMRNIFDSLALWQIQYSDFADDMRKSNLENELCQSSIFGNVGWPVRARRRRIAIVEMGPFGPFSRLCRPTITTLQEMDENVVQSPRCLSDE
jgi:hypothetical protein